MTDNKDGSDEIVKSEICVNHKHKTEYITPVQLGKNKQFKAILIKQRGRTSNDQV